MKDQRKEPAKVPVSLLAMLDRLSVGYYRSGPDGRILDVNQAGAGLFGFTPEELLAGVRTDRISPAPELWRQLRSQAERQGGVAHFVTLALRKDGSPIYVETNIQAVRDSAGEITGFEGVFRDVSGEVDLIRSQQATLREQRRISERTAVVASMQEQLLYSLSHDLKTPPVVIQGFSELLLRGRYGAVSAAQEKPLRTIHRNVQYMVEMVEHVLVFSRLLRGLQHSRTSFSLSGAWADILSEIEAQDPLKAGRFIRPAAACQDQVTTSQDAVHYILGNVASSMLALAAPEVSVASRITGAGPEVALELQVPALASDHPSLARLLDSFYSERNHDTGTGGLGLGAGRYVAAVIGADLALTHDGENGALLTLRLPR